MYTKRIISMLFVLVLLLQIFVLGGCRKEPEVFYTVNFCLNYPNSPNKNVYVTDMEVTVKSGGKITQPKDPRYPALFAEYELIFKGWFQESACINSWAFYTDTVTCDMVLYAKWEKP